MADVKDSSLQHRLLAAITFLAAFIIYSLTVYPTTSFWDPGEFIAVAEGLQVNHPPGAPFYSLTGRIFAMFVPAEYVALSINFISIFASAFTVMFLYLVIVRLIEEFKGRLESMNAYDRLATFSAGLIGALTFSVTDTFWFNAVEAEVYAPSMFFTSIVVWMALKWSEHHEDPDSDRWLVVIAYMFGLALGVHLLNLLTLFFVALIIYFKRETFSVTGLLKLGAYAVGAFLLIYPVTMFNLTDLIDDIGKITFGLVGPALYLILIIALTGYAIWFTHHKGYRFANLAVLSYAMILIGFSTYSLIFIRAQADPPVNENDPSTPEAIVSYLKREQYGDTPLLKGYTFNNETGTIDRREEVFFPRRHSSQPHHQEFYARYDSDLEYFWDYQLNHMYWRYFGWNFVGRDSDIQDAIVNTGFMESRNDHNPAHTAYFFLPLFFGLLGLLYHFRADPTRALSVLALFFLTGLAIIIYLNQSPFEPRERDYAYVGSYFAFSIWIGFGMYAILDFIRNLVKEKTGPAAALLALSILALPVWVGAENWESHDRTGNYVARDYAWNLLQSLEPNAIVFTNGDNDTFPLWYIQEVEGVRTDVRVVCLSLLNTDWYIKQMRDLFSHESRPLPIGLNDAQVSQITAALSLHEPGEINIPVNKELLRKAFSNPDPGQEWTGVNTQTANFDHQIQSAVPYSLPVEELDDQVRWYLQGRSAGKDAQGNDRFYLQTQDVLILDILRNNQWLRPVYFANTVSRSSQLGLQDYFQYEGKTFRVIPKKRPGGNFGTLDPKVHEERLNNFLFTNWNNPDVYFDENIRRMLGNYRFAFTELSDYYIREGNKESARVWLVKGFRNIPFRGIEDEVLTMVLYGYRLAIVDALEEASELAVQTEEEMFRKIGYSLEDISELEVDIAALREEAQQARGRGDLDLQRDLTREADTMQQQINSAYQDINFNSNLLVILQRIHYLTQPEGEDRASALAVRTEEVTSGRITLPLTEEENKQRVDMFNLGF